MSHVSKVSRLVRKKAYTKEEVVAFRREIAHLKFQLKAALAPGY
jgi:hypothetical protein